mgnify:FL=1|jgi:hypothetical protein
MRCCPVCYSKVEPTASSTATTGATFEIEYKIQCPKCGFGCSKTGKVILQYDEETMNPIADDRGLRKLIRDWDSILRDPEIERIANI